MRVHSVDEVKNHDEIVEKSKDDLKFAKQQLKNAEAAIERSIEASKPATYTVEKVKEGGQEFSEGDQTTYAKEGMHILSDEDGNQHAVTDDQLKNEYEKIN
jgi:hypothetical protein